MDPLSDVITVMRTGRPRSARFAWHAPWARWFGPVPGAVGLQVVVRGGCWLIPTGADPVSLATGDVVFLPHGRGHVLADSPTTPVRLTACEPGVPPPSPSPSTEPPTTVTLCGAYELRPTRSVHPMLLALPEIVHLPAGTGQHPHLRAAVDLLGAELEHPTPGTDAAIPALLDTLLLYVLRAWIHRQPPDAPTGWAAALTDPAVGAALHAIHSETAHPWTVAGLAARSGLSRAPFARRFTALVGQPPLAYLTWWRMTTAARLLRDTSAPLSRIAAQVGYSSEFAFSAAFKRSHGTPPGRYRSSASS
ncbi:AraC family transcriptional regulator [Actinophytocola xanthii]|uniref:AraC family transcriptional regulator n=1 Tax=Actinophytocola xanthii TaxID=1912961 RepID=A0A1Q8C4G6_9PSEU|nr:AraC family transcriptional regulator [Actinophytocola xanthii]OLF09239.1 AraC family transcriptional regulator [Actinophytocola xanthii]